MILNPTPRLIPTPRRVLGPTGRLGKTSSGSSSGYSKRVVDRHMSILQAQNTQEYLSGGLEWALEMIFPSGSVMRRNNRPPTGLMLMFSCPWARRVRDELTGCDVERKGSCTGQRGKASSRAIVPIQQAAGPDTGGNGCERLPNNSSLQCGRKSSRRDCIALVLFLLRRVR